MKEDDIKPDTPIRQYEYAVENGYKWVVIDPFTFCCTAMYRSQVPGSAQLTVDEYRGLISSRIKRALHWSEYVIQLELFDGRVAVINLHDLVTGSPLPQVRKYTDNILFSRFHLENGILCWRNDFDIEPRDILVGKYEVI